MALNSQKRTYQEIVFQENSVAAVSYDYLLSTLKELKQDLAARRFICSVPKLAHRDMDGIVIGYEYLEQCTGIKSKRQATASFLSRMRKTYDPYLRWKQHDFQGKRRRVLTQVGMLDIYAKILAQEPERVSVETGKIVTEKSVIEKAREIRHVLQEVQAPYAQGQLMYDYLLKRKFSRYADAAKENVSAVLEAIAASKNPEAQLRYWDKIQMMPKPFPFFSQKEGSTGTRIYHKWLSSLSADVRQAWLPFTVTMDIKHCQIAVLARVLNIRSLQEFLESGGDFWVEILTYMGLSMEYKPLLKVVVYSLCYGMGWKKLHATLALELAGVKPKKSFFTHPMIKETLAAIRRVQQEIVINGGMQGAYGWIPLINGQPNTVLACVAQSFETDIIRSVYELATHQEQECNITFQIWGHIHDGLMIESYQEEGFLQIQKAVKKQGAYHGMITNLVFENKKETEEKIEELGIWF